MIEFILHLAEVTLAHLLAGLVGAGLGYSFKSYRERRKARKISQNIVSFFALTDAKIYVIHSAIFDQNRRAYNFPSCDTRAARMVLRLLESTGRIEGKDFFILPEEEFYIAFPRIEDGPPVDIICLCGPKRNRMAEALLMHGPKLRYQLSKSPDNGENVLYDRAREAALTPSRDLPRTQIPDSQSGGYDFGLILSMPNPFNLERHVAILAGIHGTGTLGVVEFLLDDTNLNELCRRRRNGVIQEVVKVMHDANPEHVTSVTLV